MPHAGAAEEARFVVSKPGLILGGEAEGAVRAADGERQLRDVAVSAWARRVRETLRSGRGERAREVGS